MAGGCMLYVPFWGKKRYDGDKCEAMLFHCDLEEHAKPRSFLATFEQHRTCAIWQFVKTSTWKVPPSVLAFLVYRKVCRSCNSLIVPFVLYLQCLNCRA
jgi:hypothetical protein